MTTLQIEVELEAASFELNAARTRLLSLEARLPMTPAEASEEDLEEVSAITDVRSVLLCVVEDSVRPAIESLQRMRGKVEPEKAE